MHFQANPRPEVKLVRCAAGGIFDVAVDVRPNSPTFGKWEGFELTGQNRRMLYIPGGFAHGFQCLADNSEVYYQMSEFFFADLSRGVRWNDPTVAIQWPLSDPILSERDKNLPLIADAVK